MCERDDTHRTVLSFVRRSGRLDDRLRRAWQAHAGDYLLDVNATHGSLAVRDGLVVDHGFLRRAWGRVTPLVVEIGSGQGENVVAAAQAHPERDFLAVEVYSPGVAHTMLLASKLGLRNLRVAQVNAPDLLERMDDGLVGEVWTFFPDPWPKTRHHKRRLVQDALASSVHRVLCGNGVWRIATDIDDYALHVHEVMDARGDFSIVGGVSVSLPTQHVGKGNARDAQTLPHADFMESARFDGRVVTNFERKGLQAGRVIHDIAYRRV